MPAHRNLLKLAGLAAAIVLAGCDLGGGDGDDGNAGRAGSPAAGGGEAAERVVLEVARPEDGERTPDAVIEVRGSATAGSRVSVNGQPATMLGPANDERLDRFSRRVDLERGRNSIRIVASKDGLETARVTVVVTRGAGAARRGEAVPPSDDNAGTAEPSETGETTGPRSPQGGLLDTAPGGGGGEGGPREESAPQSPGAPVTLPPPDGGGPSPAPTPSPEENEDVRPIGTNCPAPDGGKCWAGPPE